MEGEKSIPLSTQPSEEEIKTQEEIDKTHDRDNDSASDTEELPPVPAAPRHNVVEKSANASPHEPEEGEVEDGEQFVPSQDEKSEKTDLGRTFSGCSPIDDYEIAKKIGEGTFGVVSTALHKKSGDTVALKLIVVHDEKEGVPITALREIRILKSLDHPNIINLREIAFKRAQNKQKGTISMVFDYMDHDLAGLLENPQVRFNPSQIKSYMRQLLRGVRYLHDNYILHRDMKCANILIDNLGHLKLADFGLARTYPKEDGKLTNLVVTRWYRPPELFLGETKYSTKVDIWGVGCVFGEMLKRRPIMAAGTEAGQLDKIFELCGTPDEKIWPGLSKLPLIQKGTVTLPFPNKMERAIEKKFSTQHYHRHTVNFLESLLQLDPDKRPSADRALDHRYFSYKPRPAEPGTKEYLI
ncbi:kinase-like domain-containing protein [Gorgonomyces haynaldii]|nr:kinase-like domain-containing protein [Gorgonomyces haynaldii]